MLLRRNSEIKLEEVRDLSECHCVHGVRLCMCVPEGCLGDL